MTCLVGVLDELTDDVIDVISTIDFHETPYFYEMPQSFDFAVINGSSFFLHRFNDIHVPVRLECVKFASHCLMNHPDLAKDLTGACCNLVLVLPSSLSLYDAVILVTLLSRWIDHVFFLVTAQST